MERLTLTVKEQNRLQTLNGVLERHWPMREAAKLMGVPVCLELGLASYLDLIVTSREVGSDKSDPRIFLAALERAGVEASQALYIGDQYNPDIVVPREVGIRAVLLDRFELLEESVDCPRIKTLAEVLEHL